MRRPVLALLLAVAAAAPLCAQRRVDDVPRRPRLPAAADSNDARAYLDAGAERLWERPREAADAFYWAYQINPGSAEALYGRYTALLIAEPRRLVDYWMGERGADAAAEFQAIDSLYFRALAMDPFLYRVYEMHVVRTLVAAFLGRDRRHPSVGSSLHAMIQQAPPWMRGMEAYAQRQWPAAVNHLTTALGQARRKSGLRTELGRIYAHVGNHEQALVELNLALDERRAEDEKEVVYLYESKALLEHSVGTLHERLGALDSAKAAYNRALEEDLSFYPAHVRLALISLAEGDTAAAVAALELATQVATVEPSVSYMFANVLAQAGRLDDAAAQLEKTIAAAPHYAAPHALLGLVRDHQGNAAAAVAAYQGFLARAPRADARRPQLEARVAALQGGGG
ncbi:MAG TPA: tetratricopeptide repeat protein [Longimicrobium sp.]|nr:tetratricopeptide repeat protein [Longimicrobium sp.]